MTTKTLTAAYAAGYTLSASYSALTITGTGSIGGVGLYAPDAATIANAGQVIGAAGVKGGAGINGTAGDQAVRLSGGAVTNTGTIIGGAGGGGANLSSPGAAAGVGGAGGAGLVLSGAEIVTNSGQISGGLGGHGGKFVGQTYGAGGVGGTALYLTGTLTNSGTVAGGLGGAGKTVTALSGDGVNLSAGGVTNAAAGLISGNVGVLATGASAATVTNSGTIDGVAASVQFNAAGDRLILESGSKLIGAAQGDGGTVELAGGGVTASGLGASAVLTGAASGTLSGFGTYLIDAATSLTLAGAASLGASQSLTNHGTITGSVSLASASAQLIVGAGSSISGAVQGGGGALELAGGTDTLSTVGGSIVLSGATSGTFSGFATYILDTGASLVMAPGDTLAVSGAFLNHGSITGSVSLASAAFFQADSGSSVNGKVLGGGGTLELDNSDSLSGLGGAGLLTGAESGTFSGFATYLMADGALTLTGASTLAAGQTLNVTVFGDANYGTVSNAGTLTNDGTITGSVSLASAAARLIAGAGSSISGQVLGDDGTLELAGGSDTLSGLGATAVLTGATSGTVRGFGAYVVDSATTLTLIGAITGSVSLASASARLIAGAGASISGAMRGGGGTLELAGGGDTISGLGGSAVLSGAASGSFSGFGAYMVDSGTALTLAGAATLGNGQTLKNQGSITGSVSLASASARLVAGAGSSISGRAIGGGGTLELKGGTDTLSGLGGPGVLSGAAAMSFSGFGSYVVDSGTALTLTGAASLGANQSLTNFGTITGSVSLASSSARLNVAAGSSISGAVIGGGGRLSLQGGTDTLSVVGASMVLSGATSGAFSGFGRIDINQGTSLVLSAPNDTLVVQGALANYGAINGTVSLASASAVLAIVSGSTITGEALGAGGLLELAFGTDTLSGLGGSAVLSGAAGGTFSGFGYYMMGDGSLTLTGESTLAAGKVLNVVAFGDASYGTVSNAGTLTNDGSITGSLSLTSAAARLIVGAGSSISGQVFGDGGALELASGADTISGLGGAAVLSGAASASFSGFGTYVVDSPAALTLTGAATLAAAQSLDVLGTVTVAGTLANYGTISGALSLASASARLITEAGSSISGQAYGDGGTLELNLFGNNPSNLSTLTGLGGSAVLSGEASGTFSGFGDYVVDDFTNLTLAGASTLGAGQTLTNYGGLTGSLVLTSASARLILGGTELFYGEALGGGGALEFENLYGVNTLSGLGGLAVLSGQASGSFSGFGAYIVDSGVALTLTGASVLGVGQTLINNGTITGALTLASASARLIVGDGSSNSGQVLGGGGTLELAGGAETVSGLGAFAMLTGADALTLSGFGTYVVDSGTALTLTGGATLAAHQTLANDGTITGSVTLNAASARLIAADGSAVIGQALGGGGTLELAGGADTLSAVGGSKALSGAASGTVSGFGAYVIDAGTALTLTSTVVLGAGATVVDAGTLTNDGAITGPVTLTSSTARLIAGAGSSIVRWASGDGGTLELAGGTETLSELGGQAALSGADAMTFGGFGAYVVDSGTALVLTGAATLAAGVSLVDLGTVTDAGTLTNDGTITGSVTLASSSAVLIAGRGSSISGLALGASGTLELAGGIDTLSGLGGAAVLSGAASGIFSGFRAYGDESGTALTLTGADTLAAGKTLVVEGSLTDAGTFTNDGLVFGGLNLASASARLTLGAGSFVAGQASGDGATLVLAGGADTLTAIGGASLLSGSAYATLSGFGAILIDGASLQLGDAALGDSTIGFQAGAAGTLKIEAGATPPSLIAGFGLDDDIDLIGVGTETAAAYTAASDTLALTGGQSSVDLDLAPPPTGDGWVLASDGAVGTNLTIAGAGTLFSGERIFGLTVSSGETEQVLSGGVVGGATLDKGGELVLSSGGSASGLILEGGAIIDLAGVAATAASLNGSGQLVVTSSGSVVETLGVAALDGGLDFTFESDGAGGTDIVVPAAPVDNFDLAGASDVLIENTAGVVDVGALGGGGRFAYAKAAGLGAEWSFVGTGDFLGDGGEQFLIENTTGSVDTGEFVAGQTTYTRLAGLGPEWRFVGAGDYLDSGDDQFLIENTKGAVDVGAYVGGHIQFTKVAGLGSEWSFVGSGDYLGAGDDQFLIENTAGAVDVGEVINGHASYTKVAGLGSEWKFVESGDFLGDGKDQFLIENANGALDLAEVVSGHAHFTAVGILGSAWSFVGEGDYSGTGTDSFLIENTNGSVDTGTMVGGAVHYAQVAGLGAEWKFHG